MVSPELLFYRTDHHAFSACITMRSTGSIGRAYTLRLHIVALVYGMAGRSTQSRIRGLRTLLGIPRRSCLGFGTVCPFFLPTSVDSYSRVSGLLRRRCATNIFMLYGYYTRFGQTDRNLRACTPGCRSVSLSRRLVCKTNTVKNISYGARTAHATIQPSKRRCAAPSRLFIGDTAAHRSSDRFGKPSVRLPARQRR